MRQLIIPLGTLLTVVSIVACSSDDSSSGEQAPPPASQIKNDSPQQQNQDANKTNPTQQTPVTQTPVQQAPAGYFEATSGSQRYLIPNNSLIAIQFPVEITANPEKNISLPGAGDEAVPEDKLPQVTVAVKDIQGAPVFAAGSRLIGTIKMSAPKAIFNVTGVKYGSTVYNMAANAEVTSTKFDRSNASFTNILLGALGGAGIAVLIDGTGSDRSITWWAPLIGAAGGGIAAALLFKDTNSFVQVKANESAVLVPGPR
ncbi:MAG: hypothetical protein RLZZ488_1594 [Pseudomonadota bacterium]|jgi:hypothetical protein